MAPNSIDTMEILRDVFTALGDERVSFQDENKPSKRSGTRCFQSPQIKRRRTVSEDFNNESQVSDIIRAVESLSTDSSLIADGSRAECLPTIDGKHKDLKAISPATVSDVLKGQYRHLIDRVTVLDCRYPYEYDGGHIDGAINLYTKDAIQKFIKDTRLSRDEVHVLIFHCEFSSERGPKMYRFLRSLDREMNSDNYPKLNFPEIYLLEGGYKAFYQTHKTQCQPQAYVPMLHENHGNDLRHFRVKSRSWTAGEKLRPTFRGGSLGKRYFDIAAICRVNTI